MYAALGGHSTLGISKSVAEKFVGKNADDAGGSSTVDLPALKSRIGYKVSAKDMSKFDWRAIRDGLRALFKFVDEEEREPEHAEDDQEHDSNTGQFTGPGGSETNTKHRHNDHVFDLPGGHSLRDVSNKNSAGEEPEFYIHDPSGKHVGGISLFTYPSIGKTINEINVHGARGLGLGRETVKALARKYGKLSSDPQANTSTDAVRMWELLGAKKVPTDKNTKGYFYQLLDGSKDKALDESLKGSAASVIFIEPTGHILFTKRAPTEENWPNTWSLPGGKADPGEAPADCAAREAAEETGRDCAADDLHELETKATPYGWEHTTFACPVDERFEPKLNGEHSAHVWAPWDEPPEPLHPGVKTTLDKLRDDLGDDEDAAFAQLQDELEAEDEQKRDEGGRFMAGKADPSMPGRRAINDRKTGEKVGELRKNAKKQVGGYIAKHHASGAEGTGSSHALAIQHLEAVLKQLGHDAAKLKPEKTGMIRTGVGLGEILPVSTERLRETGDLEAAALHPKFKTVVGDTCLAADSAYPVKELAEDGATWRYSRSLLEAASRRARARGRADLARRATSILMDVTAQDAKMAADRAMDWCASVGIERVPTEVIMSLDRDSLRSRDIDGRLHVEESNLTRATVSPYRGSEIPSWKEHGLSPDKIYHLLRDPKELAKPETVASFNRIPILEEHRPISADEHPHNIVIGTTGDRAVWAPPFIKNSLSIWTKGAINAIERNKKRDLSAGYRYEFVPDNGEFEGQKYQGRMVNIRANHMASVEAGRVPGVFVGDSKAAV